MIKQFKTVIVSVMFGNINRYRKGRYQYKTVTINRYH